MVAPLTKTRNNKQKMLKEIVNICIEILLFPKGSLDFIDFRILKGISKKLNELHERAKPE